jgi:long-chain fatty acid transport protein
LVGTVLIAPDAMGHIGTQANTQLLSAYAPTLGASWDMGPVRFGAVFRGALAARFAIDVTARDVGVPLPLLHLGGIVQYDPWELGVEAAYVRYGWTAALGLTFKRWSEYPGSLEPITTGAPRPAAPGFSDTLVPRAGLEHAWRLGAGIIALRGGYFYEPTPVQRAQGAANDLDNNRHVASLGLAVGGDAFGSAVTLEVFAQAHFLVERDVVKAPSVGADNPGFPSIRYGGAVYFAGLTGTVTF